VESICISETVYETDAGSWLEFLRVQFTAAKPNAPFGHNPGLEDLAHSLCETFSETLSTCAIAHVDLALKPWTDLGPGCASLARFDYPKKFR